MLELELVLFRQPLCAAKVGRVAQFLKLQILAERIAQPALDQIDGEIGDINADPLPPGLLCRVYRRAATAERVEHHVAFVAARGNDAFQQSQWLLRRIAEGFVAGCLINVSPNICYGPSL